MKRFVLFTFSLSLIAFACSKDNTQERLITQQRLQDSIQATIVAKNQEVEQLFKDLNAIEQSLTAVNVKYGNIKAIEDTIKEIAPNKSVTIAKQINAINEILRQNKEKIEDLNNQISASNNTHSEAMTFINKLKTRIDEQTVKIQLLSAELEKKNIIIDDLNKTMNNLIVQNQYKDESIIKIENEKNTVYYIIGSRKELTAKQIITKQNGLIGISRKTIASANSDLSKYIAADARHLIELPLAGKKIKLLTIHPTNSYIFEGTKGSPSSLKITNPALFWSKSKFLIIMYN